MSDPNITHSWVADSKYITISGGTSVSNLAPQKGNVPLVGAVSSQPTFSSAWGSKSKGMLTFDGVSQYLNGDAIASLISGSAKPFTLIISFQILTVAQDKEMFRFHGPPASWVMLLHKDTGQLSQYWEPFVQDDTSLGRGRQTLLPVDTAKHVMVIQYSGVGVNVYIDNTLQIAVSEFSPPVGVVTVSQFYVGAGAAFRFTNMRLRSMQFAPSVVPSSTWRPISNFSLAEAA